ncbi:MAG: PD-(D/E)XK nuclease family protein [Clostridia bacterium]|nr:PD-(D/E)XK nuclease family protein [Clostridia bacterium]
MLQFIFGKPASGKTYTIINKIKQVIGQDKECVLIVPEQFTFESERALLQALGDKAALKATVLSFSRLYDEILRNVGGLCGTVLSSSDKIIFMKRALREIKSELTLWSKYADSVSFAKIMLDTVGEFKINAVTPEKIRDAAAFTENTTLKTKLSDIALIYETFDILTGEKFIDPADNLTILYRKLADFDFFKGKTVFFDCFRGFTGQQYKIIERIMAQSEDVYIALTNDVENSREYNVYTNIRISAERISKIARKYNIDIDAPLILGESRYTHKELNVLEGLLSGKNITENISAEHITICSAVTAYDEAEFTARTIRRLVRTKGYRYRDFIIIARDAEKYKEAVFASCERNSVSCFYDSRIPLSAFPLAVAVEAAISAKSISTENILRFHKSGLGTLETDEISQLENYALLWNIDGELWLKEWDMNPKGFASADDNTAELSQETEQINNLRKRAISPLLAFRDSFKGNAADMVRAIIALIDACAMSDKLSAISESFKYDNNIMSYDAFIQAYDEYIKILDSLVTCFGGQSLKTEEFSEALILAVSNCDIGVIPQMLDEVTFGSADRIRPSRPKIAFVLGANQGVFPCSAVNNGLLNTSERKGLIEYGIDIADNSVYSAIDEDFLVYCSLCCATDEIYVSYSNQSFSGEKKEPSAFVDLICKKIECNRVYEPNAFFSIDNAPETAQAAYSEYCRRRQNSADEILSLREAIIADGSGKRLEYIENIFYNPQKTVSPATARKLYGKNIKMSASKLDTFNRCHFSYFCRYGLGVRKIEPAQLNVMQRGTVVHFVLEKLITEHGDGISRLSLEALDLFTENAVNLYLDAIPGYRSIENPKFKFSISRLLRSLKEVVRHIAAELSQSDFKPVACELKIGKNGDIPAIEFNFDDGTLLLEGSIDRVDKYNGYIRIIDYKTGSKSFKLPDILFGLNMQMLLYLYAVIRGSGLQDSFGAGILYQPSKRDINNNGMAMNGLLQGDKALVDAMDKAGQGEFVPKLAFNKDGSISKRSASYISAEKFTEIFDYIEKTMKKTGKLISNGDISVSPIDGRESPACKYCDFYCVCGIEGREVPRVPDINNEEVFEKIKEGDNNGI